MLLAALAQLRGLFVDDGWLAAGILASVIAAAGTKLEMANPTVSGAILLTGCIAALLVSTLRTPAR